MSEQQPKTETKNQADRSDKQSIGCLVMVIACLLSGDLIWVGIETVDFFEVFHRAVQWGTMGALLMLALMFQSADLNRRWKKIAKRKF